MSGQGQFYPSTLEALKLVAIHKSFELFLYSIHKMNHQLRLQAKKQLSKNKWYLLLYTKLFL